MSALVLSHLDYCSTVYSKISGDDSTLQRLQNKCARYVTGLRRYDHVTPARRLLGWLTTNMRWMYFSVIIIYKARGIGQPAYLLEHFNTQRRMDLGRVDIIPELASFSSKTGRKSLVYECSKFWNELPNRIRHIPSFASFKTALYKYLFDTDFQ